MTQKISIAQQRSEEIKQLDAQAKVEKKEVAKPEKSWMDNPAVKQVGRTAASILTRSLLGVLGLGGTTRRKKRLF